MPLMKSCIGPWNNGTICTNLGKEAEFSVRRFWRPGCLGQESLFLV
jgi:hypothetical protein